MLQSYKTLTAIEWENKTNGCVWYNCSDESGLVSTSKCQNGEVCINDECTLPNTIDKKWSVVIEFNESTTMTVEDVNDIKKTIITLCGVNADEFTIAVEYNEERNVVSLIILLNDENASQKVSAKIEESKQSGRCEIGVLCRTKTICFIDLSYESIQKR